MPEEESLEASWENKHTNIGGSDSETADVTVEWTAMYDGQSATVRKHSARNLCAMHWS